MFLGRISGTAAKGVLAVFLAALFAASLSLAGCSAPSDSNADATDTPAAADANGTADATGADAAADAQGMGVTVVVLDPTDSSAIAQNVPVTVAEGATVLDALNASGIDAAIEDGSYGKYITALNGTAAEGTSGWVYTINGNEVMDSIDTYVLADGDTIQFEYITM